MRKAKLNPDGTIDIFLEAKHPQTDEFTYLHESRLTNDTILRIMNINFIDIEGVTVRSVLNMMRHYPSLIHIEDFSMEYLEESMTLHPFNHDIDNEDSFDHIEISLFHETQYSDNRSKMKRVKLNDGSKRSRVEFGEPYPSYSSSVTSYFTASGKKDHSDERYSLSFTPLGEIINKPIKLGKAYANVSESILFSDDEDENRERYYSFSCDGVHPTLMEVFTTVMNELTFMGTASDKEDKLGEIIKRVKEVDDEMKKDE